VSITATDGGFRPSDPAVGEVVEPVSIAEYRIDGRRRMRSVSDLFTSYGASNSPKFAGQM